MSTKLINKLCKDIEREFTINILFAIENGSRAWRMESKDSDYDVRFVYVRPLEEYITLHPKRDVIERMYTEENIDLVGFDIFKFLQLLSKSNPTMIEWLVSDIVYVGKLPKELIAWAQSDANWRALYEHYRSLCRNNYEKYIATGNAVTGKKYLYVFRGLINAEFVREHQAIPPIVLEDAMNQVDLPESVVGKLTQLIARKRKGKEKESVGRVIVFDRVVEKFLRQECTVPARRSNVAILDEYVRKILLRKI